MSIPARHDHRSEAVYEIRVEGCLEGSWSEWFEGLAVITQTNGEMLLFGPLPDQSALYGVLLKVRDLGLPLLAVNRIDTRSIGD